MKEILPNYPFRCVLSLDPLIDFFNGGGNGSNGSNVAMPKDVRDRLDATPELRGPIEDLSRLDPHQELLSSLMGAVFPSAFWDSEAVAAMEPFSLRYFYGSPAFAQLLLNEDGSMKGRPVLEGDEYVQAKLMRAFYLILSRIYDIQEGLDRPLVRVVPDPQTGLDRYLSILPNFRFVEVRNMGAPAQLTDEQRASILDNLTEPERLRRILPPEHFELRGFTVVRAVDVTEPSTLTALELDLIGKDSVFSQAGFMKIQQRLQTLFRNPDLVAGIAAVKGEKSFLLNQGCELQNNCIFADSRHVEKSELAGSVYERAARKEGFLRVRDLREEACGSRVDKELIERGVRALLVAPLYFQGELIGTLHLHSPNPGDFGPTDGLLMEQIIPPFSMSLKRALDKLNNDVQAVIKDKCTAVHAAVEWRFEDAVFEHLERLLAGEQSELESIVFRDVYPLYGATDIRGSSDARNRAIQADLSEQLDLALEVVDAAWNEKPLPMLQELAHVISDNLGRVGKGLETGDEERVSRFLRNELEPLFGVLEGFGIPVADAVSTYRSNLDPSLGAVYRKRSDFEESVSLFNERLSGYLDAEESEAQAIFPHYFDKHKTDGVEHSIYMGESMVEDGSFNDLYVRNLRLWQIIVACGMAWHAEQLKGALKVELNATHLILVSHTPLSIRFRFDEKRFDVDGAYSIGQEIVRSRIDKAMVKGGTERLTQPGKIAIVYSRPEERRETLGHVEFLQGEGFLKEGLEMLDLDDLPDVHGLKAIRVEVNLESGLLAQRVNREVHVPPHSRQV